MPLIERSSCGGVLALSPGSSAEATAVLGVGGLAGEHRPRPVPFVPASNKYERRCDDGPVPHTPTSVPNATAQRSDKSRPAWRVALLQRLQLGPAAPCTVPRRP
jgi:hypothetical protein